MADEKTDVRAKDEEVEAHKFVTEEPGEDDSGKTKMKMKMKTKTRAEEPGDEIGDRAKY